MAKLNYKGDTIVEVILAIGIISAVLAAAYATVSRATNSARQSQERGVATKLIESQVERLKAKATESSSAIFTGAVPDLFCLNSNSDFIDSEAPLPIPELSSDTFSSGAINTTYPTGCKVDETGNTYGSSGVAYHIAVVRTATNDFTVYCRWLKSGGSGNEQASISYRVYP